VPICLAACTERPFEIPPATSVAGTYTVSAWPDVCGPAPADSSRGSSTRIVLQGDGTAEVMNLPSCYVSFPHHDTKVLLSGRGRWTVLKDPYKVVCLELDIEPGGSLAPGVYESIELRNRRPPYELYFEIGDPDSDDWLVFARADAS
jgi:hypothetical protein